MNWGKDKAEKTPRRSYSLNYVKVVISKSCAKVKMRSFSFDLIHTTSLTSSGSVFRAHGKLSVINALLWLNSSALLFFSLLASIVRRCSINFRFSLFRSTHFDDGYYAVTGIGSIILCVATWHWPDVNGWVRCNSMSSASNSGIMRY